MLRRPGRRNCCRPPVRTSMSSRRTCPRKCFSSPTPRRAARSCSPAATGRADDLANAAIAVGAFDDEKAPLSLPHAARSAGVPVNVIDKPAFCDFSFGAIVNRSPLVIGISTDGAAPVFAQAIRARLEVLLPKGFAAWAAAAHAWRAAVKASEPAVHRAAHSGSCSPRTQSRTPRRAVPVSRLRPLHGRRSKGGGRASRTVRSLSSPRQPIQTCLRCARFARCNRPT